jgi:preprotein translocase subunit YajC
MGGRGVEGTVTTITPGFYLVKTEAGETYKVNFSANTRFLRQIIQRQGEKSEGPVGSGDRGMRQRPAPEPIKSADIKVGDDIGALGEVDPASRSVGAVVVMLIDPERARLLHEQRANYGKTWLMGKVTAIDETTVSLTSALDNASHTFKADENTTFRKRREPITLADVQVGDAVRVEGAMKGGAFIATSVAVMGMPPGGGASVPQNAQPAPAAQPAAAQPK